MATEEEGRPDGIPEAAVSISADNLKLVPSLLVGGNRAALQIRDGAGGHPGPSPAVLAVRCDWSSPSVAAHRRDGSPRTEEAGAPAAASGGRNAGGLSDRPRQVFTFDDLIAAELAGYERGRMARVEVEAEQRAHELLHERAVDMLGLARREAARKGPAWAALLEESDDRSRVEKWSR